MRVKKIKPEDKERGRNKLSRKTSIRKDAVAQGQAVK
jgi:hypothetical protein